MGEDLINKGKVLTASEAQTVRELIDIVNTYNIPKEDIISILPSREGYIMIYYY